MKLRLKPAVAGVLSPEEGAQLLDSLEMMYEVLDQPNQRFHFTRIKNALCEKPPTQDLDEP